VIGAIALYRQEVRPLPISRSAYGNTINVAARLEGANKQLGTRICVSADIAAKAGNFRGRPIGELVLRGKSEVLRAFEPLLGSLRGSFDS
jgi:class 3 adenylate cyclase